MADELRHVQLDSRQIRVLAHPLRARLLGQLRIGGPATATGLASELGTNTGATSYHLRQLAEVGLVAEDPDAGRGRERWWRAAHDVSSWRREDYAGDPDAMAAVDWLGSFMAGRLVENVESWHERQAAEPPEWRAAAEFSDYIVSLSAAQLTGMVAELDAVIERWRVRPVEPGARQVIVYLNAVPLRDER